MSNKQTQLLRQLVELTVELNTLTKQEASIKAQVKRARLELEALEGELAGLIPIGMESVTSTNYRGLVTVGYSRRTEIVATDMALVPPQYLKPELNRREIRKLDEQLINSVPGLKLEVTEEKVFDVTII